MHSRSHLVTWLFPTLLCLCLSVVFFLEWRSSRSDQQQAAALFAETVKAVNNRFAFESTQTRSLLKVLADGVERLSKREGNQAARGNDPPHQNALAPQQEEEPPSDYGGDDPRLADAALPSIPPEVNARKVLESIDLHEFYADPQFNPDGREPGRLQLLEADNLVTIAKARLMTLQSEIHLLVGKEMEGMFQQGLYIDYEKGQERIVQPGVYTSGESLEGGGMRIYSFLPEQHPKLYAMRQEIAKIPKDTVRRLMALAKQEGG